VIKDFPSIGRKGVDLMMGAAIGKLCMAGA
jgi:hypothetical protein